MLTTNNETLDLWSREGNSDISLINFNQIVNATGNFSFDNKLGQGGFGPVYKVLPISFHLDIYYALSFFSHLIYLNCYFCTERKPLVNVAVKV